MAKSEKRKYQKTLTRFFRVELTNKDCNTLLTNPEVIAESLEAEFHPATFIQFINNGLGARIALMRKKDGD